MEGFTLVDAGVAGIIVLSAILAYSRGFVREAMAIAGMVSPMLAMAEPNARFIATWVRLRRAARNQDDEIAHLPHGLRQGQA